MKNIIQLVLNEDLRNAELNKMCIVRVSFPNSELQPIHLASFEQIKREDISEYLKLNAYDVDEYNFLQMTE